MMQNHTVYIQLQNCQRPPFNHFQDNDEGPQWWRVSLWWSTQICQPIKYVYKKCHINRFWNNFPFQLVQLLFALKLKPTAIWIKIEILRTIPPYPLPYISAFPWFQSGLQVENVWKVFGTHNLYPAQSKPIASPKKHGTSLTRNQQILIVSIKKVCSRKISSWTSSSSFFLSSNRPS